MNLQEQLRLKFPDLPWGYASSGEIQYVDFGNQHILAIYCFSNQECILYFKGTDFNKIDKEEACKIITCQTKLKNFI